MSNQPEQGIDELSKKEFNKQLVAKLLLRKITNAEEIRQNLEQMNIDVTVRTIYNYIAEIRADRQKQIAENEGIGESVSELAMSLKDTFDEVIKELWVQYHAAGNGGKVKVSALSAIAKITSEYLDHMQTLGLAHKEPDKHQVLGKDGKPIDPGSINVNVLADEFTQFFKAKHQLPVGKVEPN